MDHARFLTGQTFEEFVGLAMEYQELWTIGMRRADVPASIVAELSEVGAPIHLVVLNEDWCLDAVGTVPFVAKLTELVPNIDARSFGRDANPDLMDAHLTNGTRSIPVVIAYDEYWNELGWWGPRPALLQAWVKSIGLTLPKVDRYHYVRQWYARDRGATTLREIADLILSRNVTMM